MKQAFRKMRSNLGVTLSTHGELLNMGLEVAFEKRKRFT